jgi:hypothetical protein
MDGGFHDLQRIGAVTPGDFLCDALNGQFSGYLAGAMTPDTVRDHNKQDRLP